MRVRSAALAGLALLSALPIQASAVSPGKSWRLIMAPQGNVVVATGREKKNLRTVELQTFTLLADPIEGGADGIYSRFEVDCDWGRIRDIGSTAYAGTRPIRAMGSQTGSRFIPPAPRSFYSGVRDYACYRVPPIRVYGEFGSLDSVVRDARAFVKRFD
jgi:hypothetical protein